MEYFCERHMKPDSMTRVLSHATQIRVCACNLCERFVCSVGTTHSKGIVNACKRYALTCQKQFSHLNVCDHEEDCHHADAILRKKSSVFAVCRTTSSLSSGRRAPNLRRAKQMVCLVAIELVLEDEVCGELGQILDIDVDKFSWPPHNLLFDSWVRLVLNC